MTGSVITTHYGKNDELFEGLEDQLLLDNNEIAEDVGDAEKAEDKGDIRDTGDAREVGNEGDARDAKDVGKKEAGKGNNRVADGRDQKNGEINKAVDGGDQEAGKAGDGGNQKFSKVGYDEVIDRVNVDGDLEDVEVGNNSIRDGKNQDNWLATVEDVMNFNNGVIAIVEPTDGVLADVCIYLFGLLSL